MPTSNLVCALDALALAATVPHRTILDVGPGHGKYGILTREYLESVELVDAIEAWEPYVEEFGLACIYSAVFTTDVMAFPERAFANYELVLLIDVFEHFDRAPALELLGRMSTNHIVICTPRDFFQNPEDIWTEKHRSHWSVADFEEMPRCIKAYENGVAGIMALLGPA